MPLSLSATDLETLHLALIRFDPQGRVRAWNRAAEATFGWAASEIMGQSWAVIVPEAVRAEVGSLWARLVEDREATHAVNANVTRDGRIITCEWWGAPLLRDGGEVVEVLCLVADVTEQRTRERGLREVSERLRAFLDHAPLGAFLRDQDERYTYTNPFFDNVFGSGSSLVGRRLPDLFPPEVVARVRERDAAVHAAGAGLQATEELPDATGSDRPWLVVRLPFRGASGEPLVGGLLVDVGTEQRRERWRAAQLEATGILASAGDLDNAGPGLLAALAEGGGFSAAALWLLEGEPARLRLALGWPEATGSLAALADEAVASGRPTWRDGCAALPLLAGSDSMGALVLRGAADRALESELEDMARQIGGAIARWRARQASERQHAHLLLLAELTRAMAERLDVRSILRVVMERLERELPMDFGTVLLLDRASGTFRVEARGPASRPLGERLGIPEGSKLSVEATPLAPCIEGATVYVPDLASRAEPLPRRIAAHGLGSLIGVPLGSGADALGVLAACRKGERAFTSAEGEFLRALGEHVALAMRHARLYEDLERLYLELRTHRELEEQQERMRALGQMASGIAHDINNAVSPVVGFTELLLEGEPGLSPRGREYLEAIRTAGRDVARTVGTLRRFYRPRGAEPRERVEAAPLLAEVATLTRPRWRDQAQAGGSTINLVVEAEPGLGLEAAPHELRDALVNLVLNAIDASPSGGSIALRARQRQDVVALEVADSGVGMDEATRARCLEPFFTTKGIEGTGLGLATVYGMVERHGGRMEIESAPGRGTTVRLLLPVAGTAALAPAEPATAPLPRPLRILSVDDEPALRRLIAEMLAHDGHEVVSVDDGRAGIAAFAAARQEGRPFDLIITDLGMPHLDGRALAAAVRAAAPGTPVILLSGWGAQLDADAARAAGIARVLGKPPQLAELRAALAVVANSSTDPSRLP